MVKGLKLLIVEQRHAFALRDKNMKIKLDPEEKAIVKAYNRGEYVSTNPTKEELDYIRACARKTLQKDKRINIRIPSSVLESIQGIAEEEGLPYQTLISSILHKYSSGRLVDIKSANKKVKST